MAIKGRHWVLLWLVLFLAVAALVVARQTAAYQMAARLSQLREERTALEARRAALERRIREAASRDVLGGRATSLGLHQPADSEFILFSVPGDRP